MKKLIALTATIAVLLGLTACSNPTLSFKGAYWNDPGETGKFQQNLSETLNYKISYETTTLSNSSEIKKSGVSLTVDESSYYKTVLTANSGYTYTYTTETFVKGVYSGSGLKEPVSFEDKTTSVTVFKDLTNGFKPVSSVREATRNTLCVPSGKEYKTISFKYKYEINYGEKDAAVTYLLTSDLNADLVKGGKSVEDKSRTYKKYDTGAYIDNDVISLLARAFDLKDGFNQSFKTIDVITGKLTSMSYGVSAKTKNTVSEYKVESGISGTPIDCYRLLTSVSETFSGATIEGYYAKDADVNRHRMIKCYTALNNGLGYICYTLNSVA